jgi:hypothetical protein
MTLILGGVVTFRLYPPQGGIKACIELALTVESFHG